MNLKRVVIGTRGSQLALVQAESVAAWLRGRYPELEVSLKIIHTQGDQISERALSEVGGKGLFTAEIEEGLRTGTIDCAVHSLKDLPTQLSPEFVIAAVPLRASPFDVLISREGQPLRELPQCATIGTGSPRRAAQIKSIRPDLKLLPVRGNVPTRISKLHAPDSPYQALILAAAGLDRLGISNQVTEVFVPPLMLPAPGQGALAAQCRSQDEALHALLSPLNHAPSHIAVEAERAFLRTLEAGCILPVGALAAYEPELRQVHLMGRVLSLDGQQMITVEGTQSLVEPAYWLARDLGERLAQQALKQGARALLDGNS